MATDGVTDLDVAHVPDKTADDLITGAWKFDKPVGTVGGFNFTANGNFEDWSAGASAAPDNWILAGAGATVSRDATNFKVGLYAAALVSAAAIQGQLYQDVDLLTGVGPAAWWRSRKVTVGAWVRATVANKARLRIDDGIGTTDSADHNGNSAFQFLTVTRTIDAAATRVRVMALVDAGPNTAQFDGAVLIFGAGIQDFAPSGITPTISVSAYADLSGLAVSNNATDAVNDLDIAVGAAISDDAVILSRVGLSLTTALTKQIDFVWAAGTNAGMRDSADNLTGVKTFHIYLFRRSAGGIDVFASTSLTPTLPDGGDRKRRIGSRVWNGTTFLGLLQDGDRCEIKTPTLDIDVSNVGTARVLRTLTSLPDGISVEAILRVVCGTPGSAVDSNWTINDPAMTDAAPSRTVAPLADLMGTTGSNTTAGLLTVRTNATRQVASRTDSASTSTVLRITPLGYIDRRGRG
jgi:hypothetical protein